MILGKRRNWLKGSSFEVFAAVSVKIPFFAVNEAAGMCKGLPTYRGSVISSNSGIYP
jgi:hypothetical protein